MNNFWSLFIIVLALANIAGCWLLIRWTAKPRPGEASAEETTGHVWDGDLTEYNKPMPRWWLWLFYLTIIFALGYLVLYPGLGKFAGVLGWSQYDAYEQEVAAAEERVAPLFADYAATPIPQLAENSDAMDTGRRLFANNCAVCHGSDARGATGYPNLADNDWLYGGEPENIERTIMAGRNGMMPGWKPVLGEDGVKEVAAYVYQLNGRTSPNPDLVEAGKERFAATCVGCHGMDGTGNQAIGAPNLTDETWLHGGSIENIRDIVANGRTNQMPAHADLLGEDRVHVLAAYVYSLSHPDGAAATPGANESQ
ncbi:Cbb3-type cytochrome c oxidase subunit protein [Salinisphaera shabanensis E1L3A]|uniref:Cbb3-type cytochrome c oxidase subunit n=1 Tax=Salinisphaera shabanensis E1L3A TaxID=1033802 RepID=U2EIS7_9GAMM|nr:cytochrome-c oxidase, cbb3-type subunit III [Salinisphaera shabanensis]ERJ18247.1 Cbb3-type cytochrome c oxidase subunit protein [Salinisphaera shabanensis E1L3A]